MSLSNERSPFWREPARARQLSINRLMRDSNEFPIAEQEKIDPAFFAGPSGCGGSVDEHLYNNRHDEVGIESG
jgi:hypothetical protein